MTTGNSRIIEVGDVLIAVVHDDLPTNEALDLVHLVGDTLVRRTARGVVFDLSRIEIIDSFLGRVIGEMASLARLLGAQSVIAGMRPHVAITLVELGLELRGIRAARTVTRGIELLHATATQEGRRVR